MNALRIGLMGAATAALCLFAAAQPAAAQQKAQFKPPMLPMRPVPPPPAAHRTSPKLERERSENLHAFRGAASKLGTTPEAMEEAFEAARAANHRLTRGEFIAANLLAHDLGSRYPRVTTAAILDQLKTGGGIGQALERLGLTRQQARAAERAADREVKDADRAVRTSD